LTLDYEERISESFGAGEESLLSNKEARATCATCRQSVEVCPSWVPAKSLAAASEGAIAILCGQKKEAKSRLAKALKLQPTNAVAVCQQGHYLEVYGGGTWGMRARRCHTHDM